MYNKKLDILLSFDSIKVILKYCFKKMKNKKERKKTRPAIGLEPGAFGYGATRVDTYTGIFHQYKNRKYALRTLGKFLSKPSRT